ncbi:hypothetical protein DV532_28375 (plasmid) [Pseudomonas sp. Leaf58]|uniref:hypothetical protein n=1 Tax=Pseudomonas sp. Leaf58 TaxID=1736226 RepID=UPI0006F786A3|nr:hypothetical protein [Pseudomonas sp. Leaf58]AYG48186.1 hypothetical protein DV532_28375 [Pseudomonas sp. Leaf58]KQN62265.1 hypothetical protein ASF02_08865 [Pseudomonas sp. Leaf58]
MKLLMGVHRKEFRAWSGGRLDIVKSSGDCFQFFIHSEGATLGVEVGQDEASQIAQQMLDICAFSGQRSALDQLRSSLHLENSLGETLVVQYVNDGEPFREGVRLALAVKGRWDLGESLDFEHHEAKGIASFLQHVEQ